MSRYRLAAAGLLLATTSSLRAQTFTYLNFSAPTTLTMLGNAVQNGNSLRLTANNSNQTGWAWHQTRMPILAGFDTTFSFTVTPPAVGTKAEGFALVIHDDPNGLATQGGTVWGLGYGRGANASVGIRNSIVLELDTFLDAGFGDTSSNELSLHTTGPSGNNENEQFSVGRATPATVLSNGQVHTLRLRYVPGTFEVFVDNAAAPTITAPFSLTTGGLYLAGGAALPPPFAGGTAFVGFCAATGAGTLTEAVDIHSWTWNSTPLYDPCYAGTVFEDVLRVDGSAGDSLRTVHLSTYSPFTIQMAAPTSFGPGAPWALALSLAATPGAPGTATPFGPMCMQVLPLGSNEIVLADSLGGGLLGGGPATFTLSLPPALVTSPLTVTIQGVIGVVPAPLQIGTTNAIDIDFQPAPPIRITSVTPLSTAPGQTVTISGQSFQPGMQLLVNGIPTTPTLRTLTQVQFPFPPGLACGSSLALVNPSGDTATAGLNPVPTVTSTALGSGTVLGGQTFVVTGTGYAPGTTVTIGGAAATVLSANATAVAVRTPPGVPGVATVVLTTPGGCTATTTYTYF